MNNKRLTLALGGAIASSLLAATAVQASENPFGLSSINQAQQLAAADDKSAEGGCSGKMKEGKCGEGKCGNKMKGAEGGCSGKMPEGGCSGKMPEGGCSGKTAQ